MPYYVVDQSNSYNDGVDYDVAYNLAANDDVFVVSDGYILATGTSATAIYVPTGSSGTTLNIDGLVYGTYAGIDSRSSGVGITINGHVSGDTIGVSVMGGNVHIGSAGVVSGGSDGVIMRTGTVVINDGTVSSNSNAVFMFGGTLNNNGLLSAPGYPIFYDGDAPATITNTGTVQGNLVTYNYATSVANLQVSNSGQWSGNLWLSPGNDYLSNTGMISGDVDLAEGTNRLDSRYGIIAGAVKAGSGNDTILLGAGDTLITGGAGGDSIDGGAGFDTVSYSGSTAGVSVNLLARTASGGDAGGDHLSNIEGLQGTNLRDTLVGDDNANVLDGLTGRDTLTGNGGDDTLMMAGGGASVIDGGTGNDLIQLRTAAASTCGFAFNSTTQVQGGSGYDTLELYHVPITIFSAKTVAGIEHLMVDDGYDYDFTTVDATVASGARMTVDGSSLTVGNYLRFNGAAETNGAFDFLGGDANDVLVGGALADTFVGGAASDTLTGGAGADTFIFNEVADSLFLHRDRITDFNASADHIQLDVDVTGINARVSGSASNGSDLALLVKGHLTVDHAILVDVTGGSLSGSTFLLIDANHTAGFQGTADYCIDVTGMTGTLVGSAFIL